MNVFGLKLIDAVEFLKKIVYPLRGIILKLKRF